MSRKKYSQGYLDGIRNFKKTMQDECDKSNAGITTMSMTFKGKTVIIAEKKNVKKPMEKK